ncbi:DNA methyltransferase [Leptospirillum ferriphilum]|uniref:DNA methyltransferase n=1 Tax=Leptospirillum ferriphilum TaxID=178606 RepID=UPI000C15913D
MRWLCRLVTPEGGLVLDPFMGSGSTGKAALEEGFRFIGIENNAEYFCYRVRKAGTCIIRKRRKAPAFHAWSSPGVRLNSLCF